MEAPKTRRKKPGRAAVVCSLDGAPPSCLSCNTGSENCLIGLEVRDLGIAVFDVSCLDARRERFVVDEDASHSKPSPLNFFPDCILEPFEPAF